MKFRVFVLCCCSKVFLLYLFFFFTLYWSLNLYIYIYILFLLTHSHAGWENGNTIFSRHVLYSNREIKKKKKIIMIKLKIKKIFFVVLFFFFFFGISHHVKKKKNYRRMPESSSYYLHNFIPELLNNEKEIKEEKMVFVSQPRNLNVGFLFQKYFHRVISLFDLLFYMIDYKTMLYIYT